MSTTNDNRLVLRITKPTVLKRRVVPDDQLAPEEKTTKEPCRIFIHSYAHTVPGEDLQNHFKVCFAAPLMGSSVWYVDRDHSLVENPDSQPAPPQPQPAPQPDKQVLVGKTNDGGVALIKQFEGLKLDAYVCPAGVLTIGYGTTGGVKKGDRITEAQAEAFLRRDLEKFEKAVASAVKVPLTSNQFSALVSFTYNLGAGALQKSTLLKVLNEGNYEAAAQEFLKWNKAGGRVLDGLTKRRQAERALFLKK